MKKIFFIFIFVGFLTNAFSQTKADVVALTKDDFLSKVYNYQKNPDKWIYEGSKPCIIDFYADWCGPCKKLAPIMAELANLYSDKVIIYKIDVDKEQELAQAFGVSSIPTILFIPMANNPQITKGLMSKEDLENVINKLLLKK